MTTSKEFRPDDPDTAEWTFTCQRWARDKSLIVVEGEMAVVKEVELIDFDPEQRPRGHLTQLLDALRVRFGSVEVESVRNSRLAKRLERDGWVKRMQGVEAFQADPEGNPCPVERWYRP
jgi:hypothetical protein